METKDFTILKQLSDEAQLKVELKLTVRELFAYAKYLIVDEKAEVTTTVQRPAVLPAIAEAPKVEVKAEAPKAEVKVEAPEAEVKTEAPEAVRPDVAEQSKTPKRRGRKAKVKTETAEGVQTAVPESEASEQQEPEVVDGVVYYRAKDVADVYNVNVMTVYIWINKGLLKCHHKKGNQMYFAREDVERIKRRRNTKKK
jgi:hypothetical protein